MDYQIVKKVYGEINGWLADKNLLFYQKKAVRAVVQSLTRGENILLVEMSAGCRKHFNVSQ